MEILALIFLAVAVHQKWLSLKIALIIAALIILPYVVLAWGLYREKTSGS